MKLKWRSLRDSCRSYRGGSELDFRVATPAAPLMMGGHWLSYSTLRNSVRPLTFDFFWRGSDHRILEFWHRYSSKPNTATLLGVPI